MEQITDKFKQDEISALDAKFEAQKIAFSPLSFQAVRALLNLGILKIIEEAGNCGSSASELSQKTQISEYGIKVLCEMALSLGVLRLNSENEEKFILGKIGWHFLEDELTRVNFFFTNDICYQGAFYLEEAIRTGKPKGLEQFGTNWQTIYEALSTLPEPAKSSWFNFDHFYSDIAFPDALSIIFSHKPKHLVDIGGNTAKWAISCCKYDPEVAITIVDLEGQTKLAQKNIEQAGLSKRISTKAVNVLKEEIKLENPPDAVMMSQFLDCFALSEITEILKKLAKSVNEKSKIFVLEPLWDKQRFLASSYSLHATSLYFTAMANGNSKMYSFNELVKAIEKVGFRLNCAHHNLGSNSYSLLEFVLSN